MNPKKKSEALFLVFLISLIAISTSAVYAAQPTITDISVKNSKVSGEIEVFCTTTSRIDNLYAYFDNNKCLWDSWIDATPKSKFVCGAAFVSEGKNKNAKCIIDEPPIIEKTLAKDVNLARIETIEAPAEATVGTSIEVFCATTSRIENLYAYLDNKRCDWKFWIDTTSKSKFVCDAITVGQKTVKCDIGGQSSTEKTSNINVKNPCENNKCWDKTSKKCIDNQKDAQNPQLIENKICIDGNWQYSDSRYTPNKESRGYCPEQNQCLVSLSGDPSANNMPIPEKNPRCIAQGQFINNDYCDENGEWSTLTKFVALQLKNMVSSGSDYILFCGSPETVLNDLSYQLEGKLIKDFISKPNNLANNFCVLSYTQNNANKVVIGTSLNKPLEEDKDFLKSISVNIDACNGIKDDGTYQKCSNTNAWYNKKMRSIIYNKNEILIGQQNTQSSFLKNIFAEIKTKLGISPLPAGDNTFVENLARFDKLYLSKNGNKEIKASIDERGTKNLLAQYFNFNTDICKIVENYNAKNNDASSGIKCRKDGNAFYVIAQGSSSSKLDPSKIWNDLTSKLRVI